MHCVGYFNKKITYGTSRWQIPDETRLNVSLTNFWYCGGWPKCCNRGADVLNGCCWLNGWWLSYIVPGANPGSIMGYRGVCRFCTDFTLSVFFNVNNTWPVSIAFESLWAAPVNDKHPMQHTIAIKCIFLSSFNRPQKKFQIQNVSLFPSQRTHTPLSNFKNRLNIVEHDFCKYSLLAC